MPSTGVPNRTCLRLAVALALAGGYVVRAQDDATGAGPPTGLRAVLSYSLELEADDNRDLEVDPSGTSLQFDQRLGLSVRSETRTETFALDTGTTLRSLWRPDDSFSFDTDEPNLSASYTRETAGAAFRASGSFRRRELEFLEPFFLDNDGDTVIDEAGFTRREGTLSEARLDLALETGRDRPIGTTYSFDYATRQYDTRDPDLFDTERFGLSTQTRLRFSDVTTGSVNLRHQRYYYDDATETEGRTSSISLGLSRALDETLTLGGSLGYSRREEVETVNGNDETITKGLNFGLEVTKDVPFGTLFGNLDRNVTEDGFRDTLRFGRTYDLQQSSFSGSVGLTRLQGEDLTYLVTVAYARDLRDGEFNATLTRNVTSNTVGEEDVLTILGVGYSTVLAPSRSLGLNLDVAQVDSVDADQVDDSELEAVFTASVSQALTREWNMEFGYRGQLNDVQGGDQVVSNSVFVTLGRSFILRP